MPRDFLRSRRIAEQIQRELAELIRLELKDPRIASLVTITGVEVSADQSHAKVSSGLRRSSSSLPPPFVPR